MICATSERGGKGALCRSLSNSGGNTGGEGSLSDGTRGIFTSSRALNSGAVGGGIDIGSSTHLNGFGGGSSLFTNTTTTVSGGFGGYYPPAMPLARTKSLLASLNSDSNPLADTSLSNSSLNANNLSSQNIFLENCITGATIEGGGQTSLLPPLGQMPAMKTTGATQYTPLFVGDDNSNQELNGTLSNQMTGATPMVLSSNDTSLPAVRPTSVESVSVKNGSARQPKTYVATPKQVMKYYMNKLTPYEQEEIYSYAQIYFIGANARKRPGVLEGDHATDSNYGYDDLQGSYVHIPHDHIQYRYEVLKVIGKGSFGQVLKAYDHKNHLHVALKIVRNEKRFHRQAQEEIRILEHLKKQDKDNTVNIIHMFDHFTFRCHTCITFELLSINLYELIKKNKFMGFSLQLVRKFAHSLLFCLDALYKNKIIHCDMKPENVLLKQQGRSGIKVRDDKQFDIFIHCLIGQE